MTTRDHPLPEAAELLGCKLRWLQDNYRRFEHQGYGKAVVFTEDQLDAVRAACRVEPESGAVQDEPPAPTDLPAYAQLRPSGARRRVS